MTTIDATDNNSFIEKLEKRWEETGKPLDDFTLWFDRNVEDITKEIELERLLVSAADIRQEMIWKLFKVPEKYR